MASYKAYYINLDKSIQRREFMEKQLSSFNIFFERFPAVDGNKLESDFIKHSKKKSNIFKHFQILNLGEIGLIKSYFDLFEIISHQKEDFAIIFEDDVLIDKSLFQDIDIILSKMNITDFIDISGKRGFYSIKENDLTKVFAVPPRGTTGQILGKQAAIQLGLTLKTYEAPIDVMLQEVSNHKVKILNSKKAYVYHSDDLVGGTTIQNKKLVKFKKVIREFLRPLWQLSSILFYKNIRFIKNYFFYKLDSSKNNL